MRTPLAWLNRGFHKQIVVTSIGLITAVAGFVVLATAGPAHRDLGWGLQLCGTAVGIPAIYWGLITERRQHRDRRP